MSNDKLGDILNSYMLLRGINGGIKRWKKQSLCRTACLNRELPKIEDS